MVVPTSSPANYEEKSQLDIIIKGILGRIARKHGQSLKD